MYTESRGTLLGRIDSLEATIQADHRDPPLSPMHQFQSILGAGGFSTKTCLPLIKALLGIPEMHLRRADDVDGINIVSLEYDIRGRHSASELFTDRLGKGGVEVAHDRKPIRLTVVELFENRKVRIARILPGPDHRDRDAITHGVVGDSGFAAFSQPQR